MKRADLGLNLSTKNGRKRVFFEERAREGPPKELTAPSSTKNSSGERDRSLAIDRGPPERH